jgi:hypothetical protein
MSRNLYNSIENTLELDNAQTYLPAFTQTLKFDNSYSKKMFILNSKFVLLGIDKEKVINIENNSSTEIKITDKSNSPDNDSNKSGNRDKNKNRLSFTINQSLQGNIMGKIVNHKLYQKSKCEDDYQRFVAEIPMFIKSNPLLDVISYMEGKYDFHSSIPSVFSMLTNKKINDINNNAYLEVICAYFLNLLQEKKKCTLFPHFYGAFNGLARNYVHDISEDYPHIRNSSWFEDKSESLGYEVVRNNNLQDYQALSFKNIQKIDYNMEKDLQYKKGKEDEINGLDSQVEQNFNTLNRDDDLWDKEQNLEAVDWSIVPTKDDKNKDDKNKDCESNLELENFDINSLEEFNSEEKSDIDNISDDCSEGSWSSLSSDGSCIFSETFLRIKNFPVQILAMERLDITLTDLVKQTLSLGEWKSILFEVCFGLAVAQKNFGFIHNDLHSDNIMFKKCKLEYKYYKYQNTFFRVPTWNRETKVIDFARGILRVGKKNIF